MKIACTLIKLVDRIEFHFETDWNDLKIVPALTHRKVFSKIHKLTQLHVYYVIKQWFEERSTSGFFFYTCPKIQKVFKS